jgi:uncharacterized protein (DUF305 family)
MRRSLPWPLVVTALATLALLAGVALASDTKPSTSPKAFNATDIAFAANMTPHHTSGVELGRLAVEKAVDPRIRAIGQDIADTQTRELGILRKILAVTGAEPTMTTAIEERDEIDMARLQTASGEDFDRTWLDVISAHHAAAIQMAQIEEAAGRSGQATRLAGAIVDTQARELTIFNGLVRELDAS